MKNWRKRNTGDSEINFTSRLRLELRSKAPQASRISTTLSGHERATLISTFKDINFIPQEPIQPQICKSDIF
jgi:hypothetical protein